MFLHSENPSEYPRRILVAVTGPSPQSVPDTLYAVAVAPASAPAFVPTAIHLITTRSGAETARLALLSDDPARFHRFCVDDALTPIAFSPARIHVLQDVYGRPLDDIRSPEDNRLAADRITALIRDFTGDPDSALHVSIAGGARRVDGERDRRGGGGRGTGASPTAGLPPGAERASRSGGGTATPVGPTEQQRLGAQRGREEGGRRGGRRSHAAAGGGMNVG